MKRLLRLAPALPLAAIAAAAFALRNYNFAVLNPAGTIASQQRDLIVIVAVLSLVIVLPVFVILFGVLWRYRESNTKAHYEPELDGNKFAETVWWVVPSLIIGVLSVMIWRSSHALDPYKPLVSPAKPVTVQVVALDWKWLFIYPEEDIATVNYLKIPTDTPINFVITSDAPMNSLWIPQLGGQIYAMPGMTAKLHLAADRVGTYGGRSANLSGKGFSGMTFDTDAVKPADYATWVRNIKASNASLDQPTYDSLAQPSEKQPVTYFGAVKPQLYDTIIMKYMAPLGTASQPDAMEGMSM